MSARSMIRVCHIIHDLRRGGAEHLLVDLARNADEVGLAMTVVAPMALDDGGYAADLRDAGVRVVSLGLSSRWDPRGARRLERVLRTAQPDIVHTHLKHADLLAARVAPRLGIPFVSSLHVIEQEVTAGGRAKRWAATRARCRHAALTIAVSDAVRDWYLSMSGADPHSVVTLRNGVARPPAFDDEQRSGLRASLGIPDGGIVAVTLAVLRPGKGIEDLLASADGLGDDSPVRFLIAGSGPEEASLRRRASELGVVGNRVHFLGFVEEVAGLLAAADLLVHPSHRDALPTAVIHGMAAGLPAVATDVGGTAEVVTEDTGLLVPPGRPEQLAAAITVLAADPDLRWWMGKRARERFDEEFSVEIWARRLRSRYEEVLGRSN